MQQTVEKLMSARWRLVLSILIGIFIALETTRFIWRLSHFETYGLGNIITHGVIVGILLLLLILTALGKRIPALFCVFVITINLLLIVIYPYNISHNGNFRYDSLVGQSQFLFSLPELLFYFYLLIQAVLVTALWRYYFSEYLFNEFWNVRRSQNQIEFEKLLKQALAEMEQAKTI